MIGRGSIAMLMACAVAVPLAGCDKAQTASEAGAKKPDAKPWEGANAAYTASGWKVGDKAEWEAQLKARAVRGQNEYARAPASTK